MRNFLKSFKLLSDKEIEAVLEISIEKRLNKNDFFIQEGQICNEFAFINKGILRSFYLSNAGIELTYCIHFPNNLVTAYSSFITEQKTEENIQAITNVEMLVISKTKFNELSKKFPNFIIFQKFIAEQQYIELEKRIMQLQKTDAKQRYLNLLQNQPEYINYIPLQFLASYLNITQRHLSRIRSNITF